MALDISVCDSQAAAEAACARQIVESLGAALSRENGRVSFMVSGGSTPARVLPLVLEASLAWDRVDVFASDERLVPADHPDSTEGMVRQIFAAAGRELSYHGVGDDLDPDTALSTWSARLRQLAWPVAVGFIGIGGDAHYASLFPGLPASGDPDLEFAAIPETAPHRHARLTLGRATLAKVGLVTLVAAGSDKLSALEAAMKKQDPINLPACTIGESGRAIAFTTAALQRC